MQLSVLLDILRTPSAFDATGCNWVTCGDVDCPGTKWTCSGLQLVDRGDFNDQNEWSYDVPCI